MNKTARKNPTFTEADMERARKLYAKLGSFKAVADIMGRSPTTINEQLRGLRGSREAKVSGRQFQVPAPVLADRERRQEIAPRDITASFFGDPLPGYSALDRR
jgi:hypothetical protein